MRLKDFITPKPNEEVLMIVRQSLIPKSARLCLYAILFLVPFFFLYPLFRMGTIGIVLFFVLVVLGVVLFWQTFRKWSHTLFVITDHRVIDFDQRGVFDRVVTESNFDQIDEVSYRMHGIMSTLFRYGTVTLALHGTNTDLMFQHIRNPARVQNLLNDLRKTFHE
jgi:uncharacterized membrane protein YdbT with pleckstrin-like domain